MAVIALKQGSSRQLHPSSVIKQIFKTAFISQSLKLSLKNQLRLASINQLETLKRNPFKYF